MGAVKNGNMSMIRRIHTELEHRIPDTIHEVVESVFPMVWYHAQTRSDRLPLIVEFLVSVSTPELQDKWFRDLQKVEKKRVRLASLLGKLDHKAIYSAFERGRALASWRRLSISSKTQVIETVVGLDPEEAVWDYTIPKVIDSFVI